MRDSQLNEAERARQSPFRFEGSRGALALVLTVLLCSWAWDRGPSRTPMAPAVVALHAEPLPIDASQVAPLTPAGAWRLTADDARFGGLSALAVDDGRLVALSDSGVVMRFAPPSAAGGSVALSDLPDGPGSPLLKANRDSEALARDPSGQGWWVGFERFNQVWRFDRNFRKGVRVIDFGRKRWPANRGVEAMLVEPGGVTIVPERGHEVVEVGKTGTIVRPLPGVGSMISDAARLPDGEILLLLRDVGPGGFRNALGVLARDAQGWHVERRVPIRAGYFINLEGLAVQPLPNGGTRLWLASDDNFQPPMTTLLLALDAPPGRWPGGGGR